MAATTDTKNCYQYTTNSIAPVCGCICQTFTNGADFRNANCSSDGGKEKNLARFQKNQHNNCIII